MTDRNRSGFTLIEIMVVIVILSMTFISTVPKIAGFFTSKSEGRTSVFNSVISEAYKKSVKLDKPIMIWGITGSNNIYIGKKRYMTKNDIASTVVNEKNQDGVKYYFFVYPSGIMDSVQITFDNDKKIQSEPMLLDFKTL